MTNFPNGSFKNRNYEEVEGVGADRYIAAYRHINDNIVNFDPEQGLRALEKAAMRGEVWSTQCSMVFDPVNTEVYIALKGDFARIWKISMQDETIESIKRSRLCNVNC